MGLDDEIRRGDQAKLLLEQPLLVEAFGKVESEIVEAWKSSPIRDVEGRERLHMSLCLLHKLKAEIQEVAMTGELAKKQSLIDQAKAQASRLFKVK